MRLSPPINGTRRNGVGLPLSQSRAYEQAPELPGLKSRFSPFPKGDMSGGQGSTVSVGGLRTSKQEMMMTKETIVGLIVGTAALAAGLASGNLYVSTFCGAAFGFNCALAYCRYRLTRS